MVWTIDKFLKVFHDKVSDDLLAHQKELVTKEIKRLEKNIEALKKANIDSGAYESYVTALKTQQIEAVKTGTNEEKYKKLETAENEAKRHADNAAKALKIEPTREEIAKLSKLLETGGTEALDDRIGKLGGKAKSDDSKKLVIAAIKARWGLEKLNGDLSSKALPRLYEVMKMVPEDHIKGNTSLKEMRRDRVTDEAPFYRSEDKLIVLNCGKTKDDQKTITDDKGNARVVSYFDHTTLHEIAHAVDDRLGYMASHGKDKANGGWKEETIDGIVGIVATDKGFLDDFKQPKSLLLNYLNKVLTSGKAEPQNNVWQEQIDIANTGLTVEELLEDPGLRKAEAARLEFEKDGWPTGKGEIGEKESDATLSCKLKGQKRKAMRPVVTRVLYDRKPLAEAVQEVIDDVPKAVPDQHEWDEIANHAAVKWCLGIRLQGKENGLWEGGAGSAGTMKLSDGRVYQQAYSSKWVSYDSARQDNVSDYQFRAPGEWFAELYAAFYLGWLDQEHWIGKLKMPDAGD